MKEKAMNALTPYNKAITESMDDADLHSRNVSTSVSQSFISLLELVSEICRVRSTPLMMEFLC